MKKTVEVTECDICCNVIPEDVIAEEIYGHDICGACHACLPVPLISDSVHENIIVTIITSLQIVGGFDLNDGLFSVWCGEYQTIIHHLSIIDFVRYLNSKPSIPNSALMALLDNGEIMDIKLKRSIDVLEDGICINSVSI